MCACVPVVGLGRMPPVLSSLAVVAAAWAARHRGETCTYTGGLERSSVSVSAGTG
jgi:hypothetical protein